MTESELPAPTMQYTTDPVGAARLTVARSLASYIDELRQPSPEVSVRNILAASAGIEPLGHAEAEQRTRMALLRGEELLSASVIPWSTLTTRAMGATFGPFGGYLVMPDILPMVDALRGDSAILAAGAQVYENLQGQVAIPRLVTKPTMVWVSEGASGAANDAALGSVSGTVRTMLGRIQVSIQLLRQSNSEFVLRDVLRRGVAETLDGVAVSGAGGSQPLGITRNPGITSASGTSLTYASIWAQIEALILAGAKFGDLFAIAGATAGRILATRERAAGSGFILDGGRIGGIACTVSPNVPASTLVIGCASQLAVSVWGAGPEIATSQTTGFNSAQIVVRIKLNCDVQVLNPTAFVQFATVT